MPEKIYQGTFDAASETLENICQATVNGKPLDPRQDIANHSPTGFQWGYGGSGPAQLALALTAELFGKEKAQSGEACREYEALRRIVAELPYGKPWRLAEQTLRTRIRAMLALSQENP